MNANLFKIVAEYTAGFSKRYGRRMLVRLPITALIFGITFAVHHFSGAPALPLAQMNANEPSSLSTIPADCVPKADFSADDTSVTEATATVTHVVDGDTIDVNLNCKIERIRFIGIDTPETVDPRKPVQCFGKEASDNAKALLTDKTVILEFDSTQDRRDKYGRLLAYVFLDGIDMDEQFVADGFAREYTYKIPYEYQAEFRADQKTAKAEGLGLWATSTCAGKVAL